MESILYNSPPKIVYTDIILFKNPTQTVMNLFHSNPECIFVSQCDEPGAQCSNMTNCQHFCSGVIVFKNIESVSKLLEYDIENIAD